MHRQAARRYLPCDFPDAAAAAGLQPALWPVGFRRELDPAVIGQVREALLRSRFAAALDGVADALGCDRLAVLMTEAGRAVRRGVKSRILHLRYQFNPAVNELLRATGRAYLERGASRCWDIVPDGQGMEMVLAAIPGHFSALVDLDTLAVLVYPARPTAAQQTVPSFGILPFHRVVEAGAIIAALNSARATDQVERRTLYIHSGTPAGFVPFVPGRPCLTRLPFLLLRYAVSGGRPRYAALATLALQVEAVGFGNAAGGTLRAVARYADTCRMHRVPAFTLDAGPGGLLPEAAGQRAAVQGGFGRFAPVLATCGRRFPDLPVVPLASDLASLTEIGCGADCAASGTIAYVRLDAATPGCLRAVGAFFGQGGCPVVFARDHLDRWAASAGEGLAEFADTLAHEMAHWLWWNDPGRGGTDVHDRRWALYADLLRHLLGKSPPSSIADGHRDHDLSGAGVAEAAASLRREAGFEGPFRTDDLRRMVACCLALRA